MAKHNRGSTNIVFVIFRLFLSLIIFIVLLAGLYSAYKHFSGMDPLKLDPVGIFSQVIKVRTPQQFLGILSSVKQTEPSVSIPYLQPQIQTPQFKFMLIADSHNDNINLKKAIAQAKERDPDIQFIIGLGDYTDTGTGSELKLAKKEFDLSGLRYFLLPGDHDLWDSRDKGSDPLTNFRQVFGPSYQYFTFEGFHFVLVHNSDNYRGVEEEQMDWILTELDRAKEIGSKGIFVFLHEPLFHPSSDHIMGRVEKNLRHQANNLTRDFAESKVKKVFAGDTHFFGEYLEPETSLTMVSLGAVTSARNPQAPRYGIVTVFEDGSTTIEDMEIH